MSEKRYSFELQAVIRVEGSSLDAPPMQAVSIEQHDLPYEVMVAMQQVFMLEPTAKLGEWGKAMVEEKKKGQGKPDK